MSTRDRSLAALALVLPLLLAFPGAAPAQVTFHVGEATLEPGATDVSLPFSVHVEPDLLVRGWVAVFRYDPAVIGGLEVESTRPADFWTAPTQESFWEAGTAGAAVVYDHLAPVGITAETSGVVANLKLCVLGSAPPGATAIEIVPSAYLAENQVYMQTLYTAEPWQGTESGAPLTEGGFVWIEGEPAPPGTCLPDIHPESPPPPAPPPVEPSSHVTFRLGTAAAAPGEVDASLSFSIAVNGVAGPVEAWSAVFDFRGTPFVPTAVEDARGADFFRYHDPAGFIESGIAGTAAVYGPGDGDAGAITPATSGVVARVRFCVLPEAAARTFRIPLLPSARHTEAVEVFTQYTVGEWSVRPVLRESDGGTVTVGGAPLAEGDCASLEHVPPPAPILRATYGLADRTAEPGSDVVIPFSIRGNAAIAGFAMSVDFDESLIEGIGIEKVLEKPDSTDYDFWVSYIDNREEGGSGIEEGFLLAACVFSFADPAFLLAKDEEHEVLLLRFRVKPDAPPGTTEIRFADGGQVPHSPPTPNRVVLSNDGVAPDYEASYVFVNARLGIIGDVSSFRRGDANGDATLDITDAQVALNYLFLGGAVPRCLDAVDADDSGVLNVTDAVYLLNALFLEGRAPPAPYPGPGRDPTPDALDCGA